MPEFDEPLFLAQQVAAAASPLLIGLDVDGVLAPIVRHANEARLTNGVAQSVSLLVASDQLHLAIVSGRSIDDLKRFNFDTRATLVGSHGMEISGQPMRPLDAQEENRLAALTVLAYEAMERAGNGAWVESKPASVVVHIRESDPVTGNEALEWLRRQAETFEGAEIKAGGAVLELFTRSGDKGRAMLALQAKCRASTAVFVGDDVTDEDAFVALGSSDITIKVGEGHSAAMYRLRDPIAVREWLHELCQLFA